ncbi:MAG: hypothetical protein RMJ00_05125 [Nitrososphaerota archaeon]|nr:hypothetical protein [Candidatus Bathyarchaeota archaeon]MCX8161806.1 hypothetical protein [Candidatus Bathyarchaeota archaeon]MDW8062064.1 hypothetical protein [Nitrososphaerota archaeon]
MNVAGLVYDKLTSDEEEIMLEAERRGFQLRYLFVKNPVSEYLSDPKLIDLHAVFNRCESKGRALEACKIIEDKGIPVVNPFKVEYLCADKIETLKLWFDNGVDTPRWMYRSFTNREGFLESETEHIADEIERLGYPLVIKPTMGSWGRGVMKIEDRSRLIEALRNAHPSSINPDGFFAQEYIEKPGFDLRILVGLKPSSGIKVLCGIARISPSPEEFRTNTHLGGIPLGLKLDGDTKLAKEAERVGRILLDGCRWGVVALDAMPDAKGIDYSIVYRYVAECSSLFQPIRLIVEENRQRRYRLWKRSLEEAFSRYKSSEAYKRMERVVHEILESCRIRWHEANSRFDYAINTRNASGFNPAVFYLDIAEDLAR